MWRREDAQRIGRLRRQHNELAQLVIRRLRIALKREHARAEPVGIEIVVLDGRIAPDLVIEIARLIAPTDVNPRGRRLDDPHAAVTEFLVHQRLDAIDGVGRGLASAHS